MTRLARVGYDNTLGYLEGGFASWKDSGKDIETVKSIPATDFAEEWKSGTLKVLDVRKPGEFEAEHIDKAFNRPLDYINDFMDEFNNDETYHIHCAGGYRSMIYASILKSRGFHNLVDVQGGFKAINEGTDVTVTDYVCPSTLRREKKENA